jgi:hypothetical protein
MNEAPGNRGFFISIMAERRDAFRAGFGEMLLVPRDAAVDGIDAELYRALISEQ